MSVRIGMTHHLLHLLQTGSGSDVDLVTSDGTVHRLHKFLLASASPLIAELVQHPNTEEDGIDGRTVLREVFARFPSEHIRVIIAAAYCVELNGKLDRFFEPDLKGTYRSKRTPAMIMAVFETLAYFQVPLPRWLKMEKRRASFLRSIQCTYGERKTHVLGYYRTTLNSDKEWCTIPVSDAASVEVYATVAAGTKDDSYDYTEEAIEMINSYFESKERSIRSFQVTRRDKTEVCQRIKVYVNGTRVETIFSHSCAVVALAVGELCEKWMRMQNQYE